MFSHCVRFCIAITLLLQCGFLSGQTSIDIDNVLQTADANVVVNPTLAKKLLSQAEKYLEGKDLPAYQAHFLNLNAHLDIVAGDYQSAYEKVVAAEQLARQAQNQLLLAESIRRQGIITSSLGLRGESLELLYASLKIHQTLDSKYVLNNLQSIGNLYNQSEKMDENLIETGELLVAEAIKRGNSYYEEQGYAFIASGLLKAGNIKKAKSLLDNVMVDVDIPTPILDYYLAETEIALGNLDSALAITDVLIENAIKDNFAFRQLAGLSLRSEVLLALERKDESVIAVESTIVMAEKLGLVRFKIEGLKRLAEIAQSEGNFLQAYQYLSEYSSVRQTFFDQNQSEQLAFNRARLETEQKIQQITALELNQQLSDQRNTIQVIVIVTVFGAAALLFFMFLITYKQKRTLKELAQNLQQATDAKSEFLARMSHEIRTPVNAIVGLTKLTQKSELNEEQMTNLVQIEQSSQTLLGVINDVLDFSKIEAGKLDIESVPFELDKLVEQAIRLHGLNARDKRIELLQYVARDVPLEISGDALRIEQVLNNLLSNAIKFTDDGMVSVSVNKKYSEQGVLLEFAVKDTGIGLSKQQIDSLFDAFTQADESITRKYGGTGLGLSICKHLVSLMGGEIWVESQPHQGATFYFTVLVQPHIQQNKIITIGNIKLSELRVLVVDDVMLSRQAIAEALLRIDINPDMATGGKDALLNIRRSVLENAPYDIVVLDWQMTDIDGVELASIINQEFVSQKPNIIMLSAYDIDRLKELGRPLGVEYYLQKPVNSSSLQNCLLNMASRGKQKTIEIDQTELEAPDLSNITLLLVEDDAINRKVAKFFLSDTKANVEIAENGLIALQMLQDNTHYDLVLMDMQMPVMDGLTASQKIREELKLNIPIVAMTAHAMQTEIEKSFAVGINAHIVKPVQPELLYQVLSEQLADKL